MSGTEGNGSVKRQMPEEQASLAKIMQRMDQNYTRLFEQVISRISQPSVTPAEGSIMGSRWIDFERTKPPTFSNAPAPLAVDDWLLDVESKLATTQCTDREKVLYASHQLNGPAAVWWENYQAVHPDKEAIT